MKSANFKSHFKDSIEIRNTDILQYLSSFLWKKAQYFRWFTCYIKLIWGRNKTWNRHQLLNFGGTFKVTCNWMHATLQPRRVLWYFHTYVGSHHFWGFKILNFNIYVFFSEKKIFFWCMKILWILLGSSQNWTGFRGHIWASKGLFLRPMYRMGTFLGVAKISNIFFWYAWYSRYFWGLTVDAGSKPMYVEKIFIFCKHHRSRSADFWGNHLIRIHTVIHFAWKYMITPVYVMQQANSLGLNIVGTTHLPII